MLLQLAFRRHFCLYKKSAQHEIDNLLKTSNESFNYLKQYSNGAKETKKEARYVYIYFKN